MAIVPGICEDCGVLFGSEALVGAVGPGIKLGGARIGPCPNCGGTGRVPDGTYDLIDDTLRVVSSAGIDKAAFDAVIELLEDHAQGKVTDEEVIQQVETSAPGLSATIRSFLAKSDPASWLALLLSILTLIQASSSPPPSAEEIADAIWAKEQKGSAAKTAVPSEIGRHANRQPRTDSGHQTQPSGKRNAISPD